MLYLCMRHPYVWYLGRPDVVLGCPETSLRQSQAAVVLGIEPVSSARASALNHGAVSPAPPRPQAQPLDGHPSCFPEVLFPIGAGGLQLVTLSVLCLAWGFWERGRGLTALPFQSLLDAASGLVGATCPVWGMVGGAWNPSCAPPSSGMHRVSPYQVSLATPQQHALPTPSPHPPHARCLSWPCGAGYFYSLEHGHLPFFVGIAAVPRKLSF